MPIQNAQTSTAIITQFSGGDKSESSYGIVYSIILDETHPIIKNSAQSTNFAQSTQPNADVITQLENELKNKSNIRHYINSNYSTLVIAGFTFTSSVINLQLGNEIARTNDLLNQLSNKINELKGTNRNDNSKDDANIANISLIGAIEFRYSDKPVSDDKNLPIAYPFDKNFKNLPVKNETVEIIKNNVGQVFYRRIGAEISPNVNTDGTYISSNYKPDSEGSNKKESYSKVNDTGISRTNVDDSTKYDGYGDYFKAQPKIHKLKLYEGDMLLESRFGQSIRFSGYNNPKKEFSPTIIIRNGENSVISQKDINFSIEEDISRDGSSIVLSSNQNQLAFLPGTIDDKGKTDFQTKPESFDGYPSKFIGDQILLNSGRIILSAKTAEMIFFSKKNYGFISDGAMSIDNKLGIDITVGDDINIMTNDRDINLITGNGSVFIGSKELEPMVKGQKLVDLLAELIDAITQQMYLTPSGPSASGPTNVAQFGSIKSKLNNILSKLNQTS